MAPVDTLHALSLTSLLGYVVGWPAARMGGLPRHRMVRFLAVGALAGFGALVAAGWGPGPAVLFAVIGVAFAAFANGVVARVLSRPPSAAPARAPTSPQPGGEPVEPPPEEPLAALDDTEVDGEPEQREAALDTPQVDGEPEPATAALDVPQVDAGPEDAWDSQAEIFDPRSRTSTRIEAPDVVAHECPRCATENRADARFCKKCSGPLVPWACETCGHENPVDATFCDRCRASLPMLASPLDVEASDE